MGNRGGNLPPGGYQLSVYTVVRALTLPALSGRQPIVGRDGCTWGTVGAYGTRVPVSPSSTYATRVVLQPLLEQAERPIPAGFEINDSESGWLDTHHYVFGDGEMRKQRQLLVD